MMGGSTPIDRASVIRGWFRGAPAVVRPPWAISEGEFQNACERCDACAEACPESIIQRGSGGFPEIDFRAGECTFCEACAEACPTPALALFDPRNLRRPPWTVRAEIGAGCIAAAGVECRVCGEFCDSRAIQFRLAVGGAARPSIDRDTCTGCGACVAPCPVGAVTVR